MLQFNEFNWKKFNLFIHYSYRVDEYAVIKQRDSIDITIVTIVNKIITGVTEYRTRRPSSASVINHLEFIPSDRNFCYD